MTAALAVSEENSQDGWPLISAVLTGVGDLENKRGAELHAAIAAEGNNEPHVPLARGKAFHFEAKRGFAAFVFHLGVQHRVVVGGHGEFLNGLPPTIAVLIHKLTNFKLPLPCWVFRDEGMRLLQDLYELHLSQSPFFANLLQEA